MLPDSIARLRDSRVRIVVYEPPSRLLERMLVWNFVAHGVAMVTMALIMVPMLPGGTTPDDAMRVAKIAAHPWLYRLGWVPWQLTALADLIFAFTLLATPWFPRRAAVASFLFVITAIVFDQSAQVMLIVNGPKYALQSTAAFLDLEARWFPLTAAWAACLYTASAIAWSIGFHGAKTWSANLTRLSAVAWTFFAASSIAMLLPAAMRPPQVAVSFGNAVGFILFEIWSLVLLDHVLGRSRPDDDHGRLAPWRYWQRALARVIDPIANSRALRYLCERSPLVAFTSAIRDVVYVSYLVDAEHLERFVPRGLVLDRVGPTGRFAIFTHLTYRHGHLAPRFLGPLRSLFPSPIQSNWRIHVRDPRTDVRGIYFVTTAISSLVHSLAARMLGEAMPMHVPRHAEVRRDADGTMHVALDPGDGTCPDLKATLRPDKRELAGAWLDAFDDYNDAVRYIAPQDRAMSTQPWLGRVTRQEIQLGISIDACEPLRGEVSSKAAERIARNAPTLSFRVASVAFVFDSESFEPLE